MPVWSYEEPGPRVEARRQTGRELETHAAADRRAGPSRAAGALREGASPAPDADQVPRGRNGAPSTAADELPPSGEGARGADPADALRPREGRRPEREARLSAPGRAREDREP